MDVHQSLQEQGHVPLQHRAGQQPERPDAELHPDLQPRAHRRRPVADPPEQRPVGSLRRRRCLDARLRQAARPGDRPVQRRQGQVVHRPGRRPVLPRPARVRPALRHQPEGGGLRHARRLQRQRPRPPGPEDGPGRGWRRDRQLDHRRVDDGRAAEHDGAGGRRHQEALRPRRAGGPAGQPARQRGRRARRLQGLLQRVPAVR